MFGPKAKLPVEYLLREAEELNWILVDRLLLIKNNGLRLLGNDLNIIQVRRSDVT